MSSFQPEGSVLQYERTHARSGTAQKIEPSTVKRELSIISAAWKSAPMMFAELDNFEAFQIPKAKVKRQRRETILAAADFEKAKRIFDEAATYDPTFNIDRVRARMYQFEGKYRESIFHLQRAIRYGDGDTLFDLFTEARTVRRGIIQAGQDTAAPNFGRPVEEKK